MAETRSDRRSRASSRVVPAHDEGMNQASWALSYLLSGVLFWGGLGWIADHFLHLKFLIGIGIVIGAALGCYLIVKRFGQEHGNQPQPTPTDDPEPKEMTPR